MLQIVKKIFEVPELQFTDKVVDIPVVAHRQIHIKTMEIYQLQNTDQVVDVPVVLVAQVPQVRVVMKTVETPQVESVVQVPRVRIVAETAELLSDVQVPQVRVEAQTVEIPQSLFVEKPVMIPKIQTVQGPRTSESLSGDITVDGQMDHETVV